MPYPHVTQFGSLGPGAGSAAADADTRRATRPRRLARANHGRVDPRSVLQHAGDAARPSFRGLRDA